MEMWKSSGKTVQDGPRLPSPPPGGAFPDQGGSMTKELNGQMS